MPKVKSQELLHLDPQHEGEESPYMLISDETWRQWQLEDSEIESEVYDCFLCHDSGMGKHPGLYCSCKYGRDLQTVEEIEAAEERYYILGD